MKKILVIAMIFIEFVVSAQEIKYGVKTGLNVANLTSKREGSYTNIFYHVGLMGEIKLSDKFAIQPELLLRFGLPQTSDFSIPIMVKYFATDNLLLETGPQIGILEAHSTNKSYIDKGSIPYLNNKNEGYTMKSVDLGLNFGASYTFNFNLNISARYNLGLTNLAKKRILRDKSALKNGIFQVSIGYFFNL